MLFVIYSPGVHSQVFLVQAADQEQACKLYLEHEWGYQERADGSYRGRPEIHESLQDALDTYGLTRQSDGLYSNADEHFASLEEAKRAYGIEGKGDRVTSHGRIYPNLVAALRGVSVLAHRLEITPASIRPDVPFQVLFISKDEWDYVGLGPEEDVRADIVAGHVWQASRYERLELLAEAAAEISRALKIATLPRDRVYLHQELGRLLSVRMGKPSAAAVQYEQSLRVGGAISNPSLTHYRLVKLYSHLGRRGKALRHYKQVILNDLDDEDVAELETLFAEMKSHKTS